MMIKFTKVQKQYSDGNECLNDINLKIDQGEFVFLVGHSGAGKSSLLKLITREEKITDGRIIVDKENITNCCMNQLQKHSEYIRKFGIDMKDVDELI